MTYAETVAVGFGAAHVALLALSANNRTNVNALGCSVMLMLIWLAGKAMGLLYDPPVSMVLNPILDCLGGCVAATVFFSRWHKPKWWAFGLMLAFVGQAWFDLLFWAAHDGSRHAIRNYSRMIDYLLAAELFCVALPGAGHVVLDVRDRLGRLRNSARGNSPPELAG